MSKKNAVDLLHDPIPKALFEQSYPMALGIVFMIVVNLIDTYWASQLGTNELAAMSFCFPIIGIVINVSIGLMIGTSVAIARIIGAGEQEKAKKIATNAILLGVIVVAFVSGLGILTQVQLFRWLGAPEELLYITNPNGTLENGVLIKYMTIWYIGAVFLIVPMMINGVLRASGDAKTPMNVMMLAAIGNAILDPLLIFGWEGWFDGFQIEGAAYATVISRAIGMVYASYIMIFREKMIDVHIPTIKEFLDSTKIILRVGIPATITNVLGPIATAVLTSIVATFGAPAVAAYGIGAKVESLVLIAPSALSSGLSPFVGQNWGAHFEERVAEGFRVSINFCIVWGLSIMVILLIGADWIGALFSDDAMVQKDIALYLRVVPIGYAAYSVMMMVNSSFNAMDHAMRSSVLSVLRSFAFAVPAAYIGSSYLGLEGVFLGLVIGSFGACLLGLKWMRTLLNPEHHSEIDSERPLGEDAQFLIDGTEGVLKEKMTVLIQSIVQLEAVELHKVRYDAVGFFVGRRQIGHIHPSGHIDLPLPHNVGLYLLERGYVEHHRNHDGHGWFTHELHSAKDMDEALWLLKLNHLIYEIKKRGMDDSITQQEMTNLELCATCRSELDKLNTKWHAA